MMRVNYKLLVSIKHIEMEATPKQSVSVFNGPPPEVLLASSEQEEVDKVAALIRAVLSEGVEPAAIGVFVRSRNELPCARAAPANL